MLNASMYLKRRLSGGPPTYVPIHVHVGIVCLVCMVATTARVGFGGLRRSVNLPRAVPARLSDRPRDRNPVCN